MAMKDGIIFLDKEEGLTSRKVDNLIGKVFHTHKVGHLGTLDPFATGLLIIGVNKGNKALSFALDEEKTYEARLVLGKATSTGDKTGEVIETKDIPPLNEDKIKEVLSSFIGKSTQIPPMTSAIKIGGKALYELAHEGKQIQRDPRPIEVYSISLTCLFEDGFSFKVSVSKGTYIRVLGEDIAKALGSVGYLSSLRRLSIGRYRVEEAITLEEVTQDSLLSPLKVLSHMEKIYCSPSLAELVRNGVKLKLKAKGDLVLLCQNEEPLAVYRKEGEEYRCLRGLF